MGKTNQDGDVTHSFLFFPYHSPFPPPFIPCILRSPDLIISRLIFSFLVYSLFFSPYLFVFPFCSFPLSRCFFPFPTSRLSDIPLMTHVHLGFVFKEPIPLGKE